MELEDAMTIFSYSSPYPVKLSLLPATTATCSAPRALRGRRSWSLDQLDTRRRRRLDHGEVPARLRSTARSHSDARLPTIDVDQPCDETLDQTERHPVNTIDQLPSGPNAQLRPSAVQDHSAASPSTDDVLRDSDGVSEPDEKKISASADQMAEVSRPPATVAASSTVDDSLQTHDAEMLTSSSPGVASSSSNTAMTAASLGDERSRSDEDVAIVVEGELEPRLETVPHHGAHLNNAPAECRDDELTSSVASLDQHQQQEQTERGKAGLITSEEASRPGFGGVERSVDDGSTVSLLEPASTNPATGNNPDIFYDVDLNDDDQPNTERKITVQQTPPSKKKRSLIGSIKSLVKSRKPPAEITGGAVAYVHTREDDAMPDSSTSQQTAVYIVRPQNADDTVTVCHGKESRPEIDFNDRQKSANTSPELLAPESGVSPSTWIEQVLAAVCNTETHATGGSDLHHTGRLLIKEPQTDTVSAVHHEQDYLGQSEVDDTQLVTCEEMTSTLMTNEELNGTKLPVTTVSDDASEQPDVHRSEVAVDEALVATDAEHVTASDGDQSPDGPDLFRGGSRDEDSNQHSAAAAVTADELEAHAASVEASVPFQTEEDGAATAVVRDDVTDDDVIRDDVEAHVETTSAEPEPMKTNSTSAVSLSPDGATMTTGGHELLATETGDLEAAIKRSPFESGSLAQPGTVDEGQRSDDTNSSVSTVIGVGDEVEYSMPPPDAESAQQPAGLNSQHLDINDNELRCHSVDVQVNEISADISDTTESLSATGPQVVKDKRSSKSDLDDATKVTTDVPSVLTMILNLFGAGDESEQATDDEHTTSGHRVVAMETPTITSGESRSVPVDDDVTRSLKDAAGTNREDSRTDSEHERDAGDEVVEPVFDESKDSFSEQSPAEIHRRLSYEHSPVHQRFAITSADNRLTVHQSAKDESSAEFSFTPHGGEDLNIIVPGTGLTSVDEEEAESISDVVSLSHGEANLPDKRPHVDRSETSDEEPSGSKIRVGLSHPPLVIDRDYISNSSGIVDGEGIPKTADGQTTEPNYDSARVVEPKNQTSNSKTVRRLPVAGVSVTRSNQLPINSAEVASPTPDHLKRNTAVRPSASDFTFVVQRQVKVSNNYERSLSTGSSINTGSSKTANVSGKPAFTFVMPAVRRRSDSEYSKNELPIARYSSTPHMVSVGGKSDIMTTPRYVLTDSNSWQLVDAAVHRGRRPVRTGSGNVFDRKQKNSVGHSARQKPVNGRLSESSRELSVSAITSPGVGDHGSPSQTCPTSYPAADALKDGSDLYPLSDQITCSMPDLQMKSISVDDVRHSQPCPDVVTSYPGYGYDVTNDDDNQRRTRDLTRSLRDVTETRHDVTTTASAPDLCRSEPCLDVVTSLQTCDVKDDSDDDASGDPTRSRLEPLDAETRTGSAMSAAGEQSEEHGVSRLTVHLGTGSSGTSQQPANSKRRPRRRRIVCLPHSSLASTTNTDVPVTSPTLNTH